MILRRLLLSLAFLLAIASPAIAQNTLVSATVVDSGGQAWVNGTYTFTSEAYPTIPIISGTLDAAGAFTNISFPTNNTTAGVGGRWRVRICPAVTAPCYGTNIVVPGGPTLDLTSNLSPPIIAIPALQPQPITAYTNAEITGAVQGSRYFNVTDSTEHICKALPCSSNWVSNPSSGANATYTGNNTHSGTETFTGTVALNSPSVLTLTNAGTFSSGTMNEYIQSLINNCNPTTEFTLVQGSVFSADAMTGCVATPSTATGQHQQNAMAGYANSSCDSAGRTRCNTVGGYFSGRAIANNAAVWGINPVTQDLVGTTGTNLTNEIDTIVNGTPAQVIGLTNSLGGTGTMPVASYAYSVGAQGGLKWNYGYNVNRGSTTTYGIVIDGLNTTNNTFSAPLAFLGYDSGGVSHSAQVQGDSNGGLRLIPTTGQATFFGGANLVPSVAAAVDIGSASLPFANLWLGTAATNNFKFQPAATAAARTIVIPDFGVATGTLTFKEFAQTFTAPQNFNSSVTFGGPNPWFDVTSPVYGAIADSKVGYDCSITTGTATLTCNDIVFAAGDAGKTIAVYGAVNWSGGTSLWTTIASFTNSSTVVLTANASQTAQHTFVQMKGATDNATQIQNAVNAACNAAISGVPATVYIPPGVFGLGAGNITFGDATHNCSNVRITGAGAQSVLMRTSPTIGGGCTPSTGAGCSGAADGQGGQTLTVGVGMPGSQSTTGVSWSAGSTTLTCTGCTFTSGDVGKRLYLSYAGPANLPLWTVISAFTDATHVILRDAPTVSSASINVTNGPLFLPQVIYGFVKQHDIEFDHINWQSMGFKQVASSTPGIGIFAHGPDNLSVKQGFKFHDNVIIGLSAQPGLSGNGPLDDAWINNNRMIGLWDAAMYITGLVSNAHVIHNKHSCEEFPFSMISNQSASHIDHGFLTKNWTHGIISGNEMRCGYNIGAISINDWPHYDTMIDGNLVDCLSSAGAAGIDENVGNRVSITNNKINGCPAASITMTTNSVQSHVVARNIVDNTITSSDAGATGFGPVNGIYEDNAILGSVSFNRFVMTNVGGTNFFRRNRVTGQSPALLNQPWLINCGKAGCLNFWDMDQFQTSDTNNNVLDYGTQMGNYLNYAWFVSTPPVPYGLVKMATQTRAVQPTVVTDTSGIIGIAAQVTVGAATQGNTLVMLGGMPWVITSNATTNGHYVVQSTTLGSAVQDTGLATVPASEPVGIVTVASAAVPVLTTLNTGIVCNSATPRVCTVTTNGAAHGLTVGEPFTIIGATFSTGSFACTVTTVTSTTVFTFTDATSGVAPPSSPGCPTVASGATGNSGNIFPPTQINWIGSILNCCTATNDSAPAGTIGEYVSSTIATGSSVTLTTNVTSNITSISLTAGDWDVTGAVDFTFGATTSYTNLVGSISTTSATIGAQDSKFDFETPAAVPTAAADATYTLPTVRMSLASTTTVFLVAQGTFTVSSLKGYGTIRARRMR